MTLEQKKQRIVDALLEQGGLQRLINVTAELIENPIFVCDMSLHVIGSSDCVNAPDDIGWCVVRMTERAMGTGVREACLKEIISSGALTKTMQNDEPVIDSFSFTPYRYIGARIIDHTNVIANATVIEYNRPFTQEDAALVKLFCRIAVFALIARGQSRMQSEPYYGLLTSLLTHSDLHRDDIDSRAKVIGLRFPPVMRVVAVTPNARADHSSNEYLRTVLLRAFPRGMGIVAEDNWIVLILPETYSQQELADILGGLLEPREARAGISRRLTDPCHLKLFFQQAKTAAELPQINHTTICFYEDCYMMHLRKCAASVVNPDIFIDPLLLELEKYDQENKTSFVRDLEIFLRCGRSISKAAKALFLHKNTMYYKISRIEEILKTSLEDENVCFSLELSLRMRD